METVWSPVSWVARSTTLPSTLAATAAWARRLPIELARSRTVGPSESCLVLPSGRVMLAMVEGGSGVRVRGSGVRNINKIARLGAGRASSFMSAGRKDGDHPALGVVVVVVVVVLWSDMADMIRIDHERVKGGLRVQLPGPWVDGESI